MTYAVRLTLWDSLAGDLSSHLLTESVGAVDADRVAKNARRALEIYPDHLHSWITVEPADAPTN